MGEPTREIYWHIGNEWIMYLLFLIVLIILAYQFHQLVACWTSGRPIKRTDQPWQRLKLTWRTIFLQQKVLNDKFSGTAHLMVFIGFILLLLGTVVVGIHADLGWKIMSGSLYLVYQSLVLDLAGVAVLLGLSLLIVKRYVIKQQRLTKTIKDCLVPAWIVLIILSGFLLEGLRIFLNHAPWDSWSPVGLLVSTVFHGIALDDSSGILIYQILWWSHLVMSLGLVAYLPFSRLIHAVLAPVVVFTANLEPKGKLTNADLESEHFGIKEIEDFSWKDLLESDACLECGRCEEGCPAHLTGKDLSPKKMMQHIKEVGRSYSFSKGNDLALLGNGLQEKDVWSCTSCFYCSENCPILVEHQPKLIGMRRYAAMEQGDLPEQMGEALKSLEKRFHPYRGVNSSREDWVQDIQVSSLDEAECILWVGCTPALDKHAMRIIQSFAKVLNLAGVSFGILGQKEKCCGDPARRMGNDYLYQVIAAQNMAVLNKWPQKKIVTTCPHCFNILKNEYVDFGLKQQVYHYSEILLELINGQRIRFDKGSNPTSVSYHDPCYLGRYNGIYDPPRNVLQSIQAVQLTEMSRSKSKSFCCGGGGGRMWVEENVSERASALRAAEFSRNPCGTLVTACPFCLLMLEDAVKSTGQTEQRVIDLAELVLQNAVKPNQIQNVG